MYVFICWLFLCQGRAAILFVFLPTCLFSEIFRSFSKQLKRRDVVILPNLSISYTVDGSDVTIIY